MKGDMAMYYKRWIFLMAAVLFSQLTWADNDPKPTKKTDIKVETKTKVKVKFGERSLEDTLVFEKSIEDTLIFAEDELNDGKGNDKPKNGLITGGKMNKTESVTEISSSLFPNPCNGFTQLEINNADHLSVEIVIVNYLGVVVKSERTFSSTYQISDLSPGTYIVNISTGGKVVQKRLFVK
jgi:hypothetical protein